MEGDGIGDEGGNERQGAPGLFQAVIVRSIGTGIRVLQPYLDRGGKEGVLIGKS